MTETIAPTLATTLTEATIQSYRERGFVRIPRVLTTEEVARYRAAVEAYRAEHQTLSNQKVFAQYVDAWRRDATMAELTLNRRLAEIAERLAAVPLRLWHDQILIKEPHNEAATEFHQDRPYWPHASSHALTAWVALIDVPVERGCMTFIPGTQRRTDLTPQDLHDQESLVRMWPAVAWDERVTIPLRAGDCTFHHSFTAHHANSNATDEPRVAHAIIYTDADTVYTGARHVVTDPLGLTVGEILPDARFPRLP